MRELVDGQGARGAYLQRDGANAAARALYDAAGFAVTHEHHYRRLG